MQISSTDVAHATQIAAAIQDYFDKERIVGPLRSNEVYDILLRKGLVEQDRHHGIKFRQFLNKLRQANQLYLIPQCRFEETQGTQVNWFFESTPGKVPKARKLIPLSHALQAQTIDKSAVLRTVGTFPKRDPAEFGLVELETRKSYPRAYELWSAEEEDLLLSVYKEIKDFIALSKLFGRQPSAMQNRIHIKLKDRL